MHSRLLLGFACGLLVTSLAVAAKAQQAPPAEAVPGAPASAFKSFKERSSYAIGIDIGRGLKGQGLDIEPQVVAQGIADALGGGKLEMSDKEVHETLAALQKLVAAQSAELAAKASQKNKKEGEAFLAENKKKEGVQTTTSGLQYKVLKTGTGATPTKNDVVTTNYRGTLLDGTEFDSSYARGQPASFPVGGVIKGWTEALQLMKVGDKWRLFIPAELAYGERGAGDDIPPNATLIFDIELLDVKAPATLPAPQ